MKKQFSYYNFFINENIFSFPLVSMLTSIHTEGKDINFYQMHEIVTD
jgi:hypothetical protein